MFLEQKNLNLGSMETTALITVQEAKQLLIDEAKRVKRKSTIVPLQKAQGCFIASDLKSKCDSPPFHQSAMDGFALRFEDVQTNTNIVLTNSENSAGTSAISKIKPFTAIRIFTGAKVPSNADFVIPQENISINEMNCLEFERQKVKKQDNIRAKGSQFKKSQVIAKKGTLINSARIALAASAGYSKINIYTVPKVSIIVSGNELIAPGSPLKGDMIYESNSLMLAAVLKEHQIPVEGIYFVKDKLAQIKSTIQKAFKKSDILLVSGGISVGKYDFVKTALEELKTKTIFHKVKQKPGKPLYFGKNKTKFVFGLPGNPAASLTCFYEYVLPFIKAISGNDNSFHEVKKATAVNEYTKKAGLTYFLKGAITEQGITILQDQESYKLTSFAEANCLVVIPEYITEVNKGDLLEYHPI